VAILAQLITSYGVAIGRNRYAIADGVRHYGNLFLVIAGKTSRSRKGTSQARVDYMLSSADPTWTPERRIKGAGSGEGLVYAVRDERRGKEPIKDKDRLITGYQEVILDEGVSDKRALYQTGEFSSVLKVASREGNTLSDTLRDIWDTGSLQIVTKNHPLRATGAHISVVGHITIDEIRRLLTASDMANGFGNRLLFVCAQRSKHLPDGGALDHVDFQPLVSRLREAIAFGKHPGHMVRNGEATTAWRAVYKPLTEDRTGLAETLLARSEAQVLRLSMLYALLDLSPEVRLEHLNAALGLWQYVEESTAYIFGTKIGDETADQILKALTKAGKAGLTRKQLVVEVFGRHITSEELTRALTLLETGKLITSEQRERTGAGRPATVYYTQKRELSELIARRYLIISNDAVKQSSINAEDAANESRTNPPEGSGDGAEDAPAEVVPVTPPVVPPEQESGAPLREPGEEADFEEGDL
jgi:hypothetical protein